MGTDQIVMPGSSLSRFGFTPSKEARVGIVGDRKTCGLLEELTTRLHDILAEKFEENLTEIEGRFLDLRKQCFSRDIVIRFPESLDRSVEKHLKCWCESLVQIDQGIPLLPLLPQVVFGIQRRSLSIEGMAAHIMGACKEGHNS